MPNSLSLAVRIHNCARITTRSLVAALLIIALAWSAFGPLSAGALAATSSVHIGAAQAAHSATHLMPLIYHLGPHDPCPSSTTPC